MGFRGHNVREKRQVISLKIVRQSCSVKRIKVETRRNNNKDAHVRGTSKDTRRAKEHWYRLAYESKPQDIYN